MNARFQRALGWVAPESLGRAPHTGVRTSSSGGLGALRPEVKLGWLPPVYDQHHVGSCTAQALAGAVEALLPRAGYAPEKLDVQRLYRREREDIGTPEEDSGAILGDGVDILSLEGWEAQVEDPSPTFDASWARPAPALAPRAPRLVSSEALDFDEVTIATELDAGHVVVGGFQITEAWQEAWGVEVMREPGGRVIGGHAFCLVGYSIPRRVWIARNSWGTEFGIGGYILLPWAWTQPPWCGELYALRAVRRWMGGP